MLPVRKLGASNLQTGMLALGLVKLGRTRGVKYPTPVQLPTDAEARELLAIARDLGINLLDTAPAYGTSETRLGELLAGQRQDWLLSTKVGETFDGEQSRYDFTASATRASVERSLKRLQTDYLDLVLIHSDGRDLEILDQFGTLQTLQDMKAEGKIRLVGISHKTVAGAEHAIEQGADVLMATLNPDYQDELEVIARAGAAGVAVLIKKALASGHGQSADLAWVGAQSGVCSIVVGTTNPAHLRENADVLVSSAPS